MTETVAFIHASLQNLYPPTEIKSFIRMLMETICNIPSHMLLIDKDKKLSVQEKNQIKEAVGRLENFEPIQYILGECYFYGLHFRVNPSVLIPRPETEELVELILTEHRQKTVRILDIGTGSGCIAISLKKYMPQAEVAAIDISLVALKTARENASQQQVAIQLIEHDILSPDYTSINRPGGYNIIVSNPPYVAESEIGQMERNVLDHEPHLALFVKDNDPLLYYRRIAQVGKKILNRPGYLYFEINARYGNETVQLLEKEGFLGITLIKDLSGKDRIIKANL
ncbi:MAG: peptide chain release factor N(5)-glutamine methyltransferase [Tannerellaceae bacterium]|nr:peptide chain release factor N(5)-glutamine methyltransferase [Tannerellaceae bacterium]MCD8263906.1 peptide chain release factor N(5)-glutamine methyltransferase [Tannerellaceae bacterium]